VSFRISSSSSPAEKREREREREREKAMTTTMMTMTTSTVSSTSFLAGRRRRRRRTTTSEIAFVSSGNRRHRHQCRRVFPSSGEERVSSSSFAFGTTNSTRTQTSALKKWEKEAREVVVPRGGRPFEIDATKTPPPDEQQRSPGMTTLEKEDDEDSGDDDDGPMGSSFPELDYLQELIAIQKDCPKEIGFFGTRNMGFLHQQLIEILAYALCLTGNHIFTSGATGTNAAVIRGSLRAERPELLTVVLPQSLSKQPAESRELLEKVSQVEECPDNDHLPLLEASRICNDVIVSKVRQVICFAFHDSTLLLDTCREAKVQRRMVTLFYLD
jgi:hypothetical protein